MVLGTVTALNLETHAADRIEERGGFDPYLRFNLPGVAINRIGQR